MSQIDQICDLLKYLKGMPLDERVQHINWIREAVAAYSPFRSEPVDFVRWVKSDTVQANDYNPNSVAPPEMELLRHSIQADGYTQPIVSWDDDEKEGLTVIDGFHRHRVGKECEDVAERIHGYLPVVVINSERADRNDRIASTIRHNRARGKHAVEAMSDIVVELKRRNWSDDRICRELGMDQDEVLRLCQITGLTEMFSDTDFSQSWDAVGEVSEDDFAGISDEFDMEDGEFNKVPNTSDEKRVFHTYDKWECFKAGFYESTCGMKKADAEQKYADFLGDDASFRHGLDRVFAEWPNSCQHYLTNAAMNRIAWLGQAAACIETGIPSAFRAGFFLLSEERQAVANATAYEYLCRYIKDHGLDEVSFDEAYAGRQSDIY